jgi:hypothetical protein
MGEGAGRVAGPDPRRPPAGYRRRPDRLAGSSAFGRPEMSAVAAPEPRAPARPPFRALGTADGCCLWAREAPVRDPRAGGLPRLRARPRALDPPQPVAGRSPCPSRLDLRPDAKDPSDMGRSSLTDDADAIEPTPLGIPGGRLVFRYRPSRFKKCLRDQSVAAISPPSPPPAGPTLIIASPRSPTPGMLQVPTSRS